MDQYNEYSSIPNDGSEELTFTPVYDGQNSKKKRSKKRLILGLSIGGGVLALLVAAFVLLWPILNPYYLKNTVDEVFFPTDDAVDFLIALQDQDLNMDLEAEIPLKDLGVLLENLYVEMNLATRGKDEEQVGRISFEIGAADEEKKLTVYYNADTLVIEGLCLDKDLCYSLPRKNVEAALESSVFHPESGSDFALEQEDYEELLTALSSLENTEEDSDTTKAIEAILKDWDEILKPKNSVAFSKDGFGLTKTTAYVLEEDDLMAMLESVLKQAETYEEFNESFSIFVGNDEEKSDEDEKKDLKEDLKELKKKLSGSGTALTFSYTVAKSRLKTAEVTLSSKDENGNPVDVSYLLTFFYEKKAAGFEMTCDASYTEEGDEASLHATLSYRKEQSSSKTKVILSTESKQTLDSETKTQSSQGSLTYNKNTEEFEIEVTDSESDEKFLLTGTFGINPKNGTLSLKLKKLSAGKTRVKDFFSLSLEAAKNAEAIKIPESTPILELDETEFLDTVRNLDLKQVDLILEKLVGAPVLGLYYTTEDQVVTETEAVSERINRLYTDYLSYLNWQYQNGLPFSNRVFFYDEELQIYILFQYMELQQQIRIDVSYTPDEDTLSLYHEGRVTETGIEVHRLSVVSHAEVTCFSDGSTVYHCSVCDNSYTATVKSQGHTQKTSTHQVKYDGVNTTTAKVKHCSECNAVFNIQIEPYTTFDFQNAGELNQLWHFSTGAQENRYFFYIPRELTELYCIDGFDESFRDSIGCSVVEIPRGMGVVTKDAFKGSTNLQFLVLHPTLREIQSGAFSADANLRTVYFTGTPEQWNTMERNEYETLWAGVPVEFVSAGDVSVKSLLDRVYSTTDLVTALQNGLATTKTPDAANALDTAGLARLVWDGVVTNAAYDAASGRIAIVGALTGTTTTVTVLDTNTWGAIYSFEVEDEIGKVALGGEYVALGSATKDTVYVKKINDGSLLICTFEIAGSYSGRDPVGGLVIEGTRLFACNSDQHCRLVCYELESGTVTVVVERLYQPILYYNAEAHRLIAVEDGISSKEIYFINTQSAEPITSYWIQKGFQTSVTYLEGYVQLSNGVLLDLNGAEISAPASGSIPLRIQGSPDYVVLQDVAVTKTLAAAICMNEQGKAVLLYKTAEHATAGVLEYYAEEAILTADGKILLFTPDGYGLILVDPQ